MGILDRMQAKGRIQADTESTTLVLADAPVIARTKIVADYFVSGMAKTGSGNTKKVAFILSRVLGEALEEVGEVPPEILELYMQQASSVLHWAATGETINGYDLPPDFPENDLSVITAEIVTERLEIES